MIIDCGACARPAEQGPDPRSGRRADQCGGCLVGTLLDTPDGIADLMPGELAAIEVFERAGFDVEVLETPEPPVVVPMLPRRRHVA